MINFESLKQVLRPNLGHVCVVTALALVIIGLEAIRTAPTPSWYGNIALKQAIFTGVALAVMLTVALPHPKVVANAAFGLGLVTLLLLALLLVPGTPESIIPRINGAKRWINFPGLQFQPSELAKIVFVLALARYLRYRENYRTMRGLIPPLLITFVPMGLILVEPDLGTSMIFLPVLFAMLLAAGAKIKHLVLIIVLGVSLMPMMYPLLKPHQKARIVAMIRQVQGDTRLRNTTGFQSYKAITATGAGEVTGYGKDRAEVILKFNALPEAHNDMVFAVICARWGLVGGVIVLGLYLLLIASMLAVAALNKDPFARLMVVGVTTIIFTQVMVNVGMTVGLLPITGMTLPLISYGGSSLVATFVMIGLALGAASRRPTIMSRPSFEFTTAGNS
ncbi:rod shape-determining protein RodA [Planctomycetales bacterium ZRK34]|nr:rod shape-determining protein RodA [Planctomycetales bacterium ZRK34]